jgi:L-aspartate oxidase
MTRYDPAGDLAARDVVAAAMVREQQRTDGGVFLSLAHLDGERLRQRFPTIAEVCASAGLNLARDPLPVSPAAHYVCGGVDTDLEGRTSVPGLFAAGEVACTRVHGANRLASNSLLEGLVFGARAAAAMCETPRAGTLPKVRTIPLGDANTPSAAQEPRAASDVPELLWSFGGLVRDRPGLEAGLAAVGAISRSLEQSEPDPTNVAQWRDAAVALVAELILRAALRREESRGGHRRTDFPTRDDVHWRIHVAEGRRFEGVQ